MSEVLLTVAQAAGYLQCHPQTVRGYIHAKRLPAVKVGRQYRIHLSDIQRGVSEPVEVSRKQSSGGFREKARRM